MAENNQEGNQNGMAENNQDQEYICNACDDHKTHLLAKALQHSLVHKKNFSLACPQCGWLFNQLKIYKSHFLGEHIPDHHQQHAKNHQPKVDEPIVSDYQETVKPVYKNQFDVKDSNPEISEVLYPDVKNNFHLQGLVKFKHVTFFEDAFTKDSIIDLLLYNKLPLVTTSTELNSIRVHASPEKQQENATIQTVVGRTFDDLVLSNTQKFLLEERWFLQLSYYVRPLLLRQSGQPALDFNISSTQLEKSPNMGLDSNWEIANGYYYTSVSMVQLQRQIRLNFHKDYSLEQVDRTGSFLDHLIVIQQEQQSVEYGFAENLNRLRKCTSSLNDLEMPSSCTGHESSRECFLLLNQHDIHRYMWQQKGKVMMKEFHSGLEPRDLSIDASGAGVFLEKCTKSVKWTFSQIMEALWVLDSLSNVHTLSKDSSSGNITLWKALSESCPGNLRLDLICEKLGRTSISAVELVHHSGYRNPSLCFQVKTDLKRLHVSINLILAFGNDLLLEFLTMHIIVAEMTCRLANIFASLYSNGYGASLEEQVDNTSGDRAEDASGTGMGKGAGLNDVSDQINDEDQLPGCDKVPIYARAQDLARLLELKKTGATNAILENTNRDQLQLGCKLSEGLNTMSDEVTLDIQPESDTFC